MATEPTPVKANGGYWTTRWYGDHLDPKTGKPRRHLKRFGSTKTVKRADARQAFNNWLVQWKADDRVRNPVPDERDWTVQRLADEYAEHAKTYYRKPDGTPTGEARSMDEAMRHATDLYADLPAEDFRPSMLRAVQQAMMDAKLARTTINARIGRIRRVFKWAVSMEAVPAHVLTGLQAVPPLKKGRSNAKETEKVTPAARSVVEATLPHMPGPVAAMVEIQWITGMRSSEVTAMRGCDIETGAKLWIYRPVSHKTEHHGHEKEIPLGPKAQAVLKPYLKPDLSAYLFSPRDALRDRHADAKCHRRPNQKPSPRKTERTVGDHYDRTSYRRAIVYAIKAANKALAEKLGRPLEDGEGVPDWTPHQLRHSAATRLRKEYGIEAARLVLGHTSSAVTEIYAEIDRDKARQIMADAG